MLTKNRKKMNYELGYNLTKQNFKILYKSAKQAKISGYYGLACSLNILACEELIKTFFIHVKKLNPEKTFFNFEKVFKDHKTKHSEIKSFLTTINNRIESLTFNVLENKEQFLETLPENKLEEYKKEYIDIERVHKRTKKIKKFHISTEEIFDWLESANKFKNSGLYVGYDVNGNWNAPSEFTKEKFQTEIRYTKLLYLHLKNSVDITNFMAELRERNMNK